MHVRYGDGTSDEGPGVSIEMTGDEVATAIYAWLVARGIDVSGPRTVTVNGNRCEAGRIYVDPAGWVNTEEAFFRGSGPKAPAGVAR